jgi:hypothetical protein
MLVTFIMGSQANWKVAIDMNSMNEAIPEVVTLSLALVYGIIELAHLMIRYEKASSPSLRGTPVSLQAVPPPDKKTDVPAQSKQTQNQERLETA